MVGGSAQTDIACVLQLAFGRVVPTTPIAAPPGYSERVTAFALDGRRLPSRVLLLRYLPQEWSRAIRAYTALQALRALNFPVPDVYYLGWSYRSRFVLMLVEYADGRGVEGQPFPFFARVGRHFAWTLAHLHCLPWDTLPDLPMRFLRYDLLDLGLRIDDLGLPELTIIRDWLVPQAERITEQPHTVLHGHYTLNCVLAEGTDVISVGYWENAVLGDPRCDVGIASAAMSIYGAAYSDQFVSHYETAIAEPVTDRAFWEVFGALRLLVGIAERLVDSSEADLTTLRMEAGPTWGALLDFVTQRSGLAL